MTLETKCQDNFAEALEDWPQDSNTDQWSKRRVR